MRRKNIILTVLMFLFVNILSMAVENSTTLSDTIGLVNPAYQEALKDYKPNLENIDKTFNYIEKNIKEKGRAIYYSKFEKGKNEIVITDENDNIIYTEKMSEKLAEITPYFEAKQIYQLKNGKTLEYSETNIRVLDKKVKIKSETLMKNKMNKKDAIKSLSLIGDLTNPINNTFSNTEYLKLETYDENNNLFQRIYYRNNKMTIEQEVKGNQAKMIYLFDNTNSMSGKLEAYKNGELISIMQIKNFLPEGEVKIFFPSGKLLSTFYIKNGTMVGTMKAFYENGKIRMIGHFKDGKKDGEFIEYEEDGSIIDKALYKNDEMVSQ